MTLVIEFLCNILTFFVSIFAVFGRDNLGYDSQPAAVGLGLLGAISVMRLIITGITKFHYQSEFL